MNMANRELDTKLIDIFGKPCRESLPHIELTKDISETVR